ncbi:GntR family transcriptional regulator [Pseudomonas luteola]
MSENLAYVIRKAILSGVLKQGMPIRERALAQELNVSRTPVREALFVLQGEGLVVLNHNRSACVAYFSSDDIRKIYSLRGVLESYSAECAAYRNDPEDLLKIRTALLKYQGLDARSAPIEQAQADLEFHEAICSAAGSRMLMTLTRQALAVTVTHRSRYAYTEEQLRHAQRQHETLYDAINAGNGKLAHLLMSQHVSQSSELAISHLSDAPNSSPEN